MIRRIALVFGGEVWDSVPLSWEVFGEKYKRLGFDDPLRFGI